MDRSIELLKGVHPGAVLEHELKKRKLSKGRLALAVQEYPQTIGAITKGRRDMHTSLALRIERELGLEEGYLMLLQIYYEIRKEKQKQQLQPDLSRIRPVIFCAGRTHDGGGLYGRSCAARDLPESRHACRRDCGDF
jgi:plasmid maintenance system antidote protein VapI